MRTYHTKILAALGAGLLSCSAAAVNAAPGDAPLPSAARPSQPSAPAALSPQAPVVYIWMPFFPFAVPSAWPHSPQPAAVPYFFPFPWMLPAPLPQAQPAGGQTPRVEHAPAEQPPPTLPAAAMPRLEPALPPSGEAPAQVEPPLPVAQPVPPAQADQTSTGLKTYGGPPDPEITVAPLRDPEPAANTLTPAKPVSMPAASTPKAKPKTAKGGAATTKKKQRKLCWKDGKLEVCH